MFTLTFVDLENETSISIWEFELVNVLNNIFAFISALTRLNSQNRNETSLLMISDTLISIWILAFPIGIIQVSTPGKWSFLLYFSSFHDYWPPANLISLIHNSGKMEWCEKRAFQLLKMRKMKVSRNNKNQVRNRFFLTVRSSSMKDYTYHYVGKTFKSQTFTLFSI